MNKKIDLKTTIFATLNFVICLCLVIFASPTKVPLFFDLKENIAILGSKWVLILCVIIPTFLAIFVHLTKKKPSLNFFLKMLFYISIYENMLIMIYVSSTDVFTLNARSEIPLSLIYILPIAFCMMIGAIKIKFLPFKAFSPFKNKYTLESEFIWKQTHIFARNTLFASGFLMIISTFIFAIFRLLIINFIVLILAIAITYVLVIRESKLMHEKHSQMQAKKDKLENKITK